MDIFNFSKKEELEKIKELEKLLEKYRPIIDLDVMVKTKQSYLQNLEDRISKSQDIVDLDSLIQQRREELKEQINKNKSEKIRIETDLLQVKSEYTKSREIFLKLRNEINVYENKFDLSEYGIYEPIYDFEKSEEYRNEQAKIIERQKQMVLNGTAATCSTTWTIDGSVSKGAASTKRLIKLVLRAFNGEADSFVAKVKWNNVNQLKLRLLKAYETINKLGENNAICISYSYYELRLKELMLEYEYQAKRQEEKEKMRAIQEEIREEEKAKREFEKVQREAEKEESLYRKALEKVQKELGLADTETQYKLQEQINLLEAELEEARLRKERALSMAQQTKRGHVYIISNIGSFGENVYKIGMTRRLEPLDRVRELGDASVPFQFDVHAMIYSDEARTLEYELHKAFAEKKVNMLNYRREFFKVSLQEIKEEIKKLGFDAEFTILPEAMEYKETLSILEKLKNNQPLKDIDALIEEEFPCEL